MPWILAALPLAAFVLRITEATLRDAHAGGLPAHRVGQGPAPSGASSTVHALPMAGPAIAAMTGVNVSTLLLNVAVIEYAFTIPGLFRIIQTAVRERDVPVLEAMVIEGVVLIVARELRRRRDPRPPRSRALRSTLESAPPWSGGGAQRVPGEAVLAADARREEADRDLVHQLDQWPEVQRDGRAQDDVDRERPGLRCDVAGPRSRTSRPCRPRRRRCRAASGARAGRSGGRRRGSRATGGRVRRVRASGRTCGRRASPTRPARRGSTAAVRDRRRGRACRRGRGRRPRPARR